MKIALAAVVVAWGLLWMRFVQWGEPLIHMDWTRVRFYHAAIIAAYEQRTWPLYYPVGIDADWVNFYWAYPDTSILPGLALLPFVEPGTFTLLVMLWWYVIGALGTVALARTVGLSIWTTVLLVPLLLANGPLWAHLGVGQHCWYACFLMPWWLRESARSQDALCAGGRDGDQEDSNGSRARRSSTPRTSPSITGRTRTPP